MALDLMILMRENPLLRPLKGVALENDFFGPKWHSLCSLPFHFVAIEMDFPASKSLRPAQYKQQVH
jgi:hypothetical protein